MPDPAAQAAPQTAPCEGARGATCGVTRLDTADSPLLGICPAQGEPLPGHAATRPAPHLRVSLM
ncbi:hypothetical protein GCM10023214_65630 [Amycolatopsis dongchuanensis]|uniref:Uncharacterized protein n=1 Tax=Amycolatopsis dongchuanensis TaxID=1070866 RepID=A0ABP8VGF5_9PSEU